MDPDLDPVQAIARVFSEPSNHDPQTSRLRNQTMFFTHLRCDLEPDITKPASSNIVVSSDLDPDPSAGLDSGGVIAQGFRRPSNHDPHTSRFRNQTRSFTPISCGIEPDITKPPYRKISVSSDMDPDPSASLNSGGVIDQGFRGPFLINSSRPDFEKVDEGRKISSQLWLRMTGYLNYISSRYVFISCFISLIK